MALPLEGITVVSLEQAVAAPFATRQLADLGARVIKVERPEVGDFARGYDRTVKGLSSEEVIGKLEEAGIANARLRSVREFLDHPQLKARDRWREVGSRAGPLHALLPPGLPTDAEPVMAPIPEVGVHADAILNELGYEPGTVASLRRQAAI
jgi:crotonobetainyl-CoA:carnitine CoA-transferase CaiB-like acyl-CoA transferase